MTIEKNAIHDMVDKAIAATGRCVLSIFAGEAPEDFAFSYSVGHADVGRHDLMLTSLGGDTAKYLVNTVATMMSDNDQDGPLDEPLELERVKVRVIDAPGFARKAFVGQSHSNLKSIEQPKYLQILWPDDKGMFPDEDGYDHEGFPQPIWSQIREREQSSVH